MIGDIPKDTQISEIENAPVPGLLKICFWKITTVRYTANWARTVFRLMWLPIFHAWVLNVLSFLVTFLLAIIIVKALMFAVNIIGELPVLGTINHIGGGALGLVLGLVLYGSAF